VVGAAGAHWVTSSDKIASMASKYDDFLGFISLPPSYTHRKLAPIRMMMRPMAYHLVRSVVASPPFPITNIFEEYGSCHEELLRFGY
jgi:hypothetical protein